MRPQGPALHPNPAVHYNKYLLVCALPLICLSQNDFRFAQHHCRRLFTSHVLLSLIANGTTFPTATLLRLTSSCQLRTNCLTFTYAYRRYRSFNPLFLMALASSACSFLSSSLCFALLHSLSHFDKHLDTIPLGTQLSLSLSDCLSGNPLFLSSAELIPFPFHK